MVAFAKGEAFQYDNRTIERGLIVLSYSERPALAESTNEKVSVIKEVTGLSESVAALLCRRGVDTPAAAKRFLHPGPEQLIDPFLLPDMYESAERIKCAVNSSEIITVFCDYDADGTTGGCALYLFLKSKDADVRIMTPNRHKEGYGLNAAVVEQIAALGCTLIITVDCGITNVDETQIAKSLGMDVVITDHHECGDVLPDTPYIIDAKRPDSKYPDANLAGCGVAFKLIHALSSLAEAMRYIDLIAIGTITDIVPLLGENRVIAHLGLEKMRKAPSAGVAALAQASGINLSDITSFGISFGLGPRINAAGRMDTAEAAIDILKSTKPSAELRQNAQQLCALNDARKKDVEEILADAEAMIDDCGYHSDPAILLAQESWNAGVIGIAAAKIAEKYTRPCVLFGGQESLVGSARSIEGINIYDVLSVFSDRYEKFGGHAQAAGLTIAPPILDDLRRDVCGYINAHYDESAFVKLKMYDMALSAGEITQELVEDIKRLEPFGQSNEKPAVAMFGAALKSPRFVGKNEKPHLKFTIVQKGHKQDAVAFYYKDMHALIPGRADFLCEPGIDSFTGRTQLIVRDIAFYQDKTLAESFLEAHKEDFTEGFLNEVTALKGWGDNAPSEKGFLDKLEETMNESRFGLCVTAQTMPALRRLLSLSPVQDAMEKGRLRLWDDKAFFPDNCIACGQAPGHTRILRVGIASLSAFFDESMRGAYKNHAKQYFLDRDELLTVYRSMGLMLKRPRTVHEIARKLGRSADTIAFAVRVFTELELLAVDKSDRILALNAKQPRKELRQSPCYASFEDLLNG